MPGEPLPSTDHAPAAYHLSSEFSSIYGVILNAEKQAQDGKLAFAAICARALGHLSLDCKGETVRQSVCPSLAAACNDSDGGTEKLYDLGRKYVRDMLILFGKGRRAKSRDLSPPSGPFSRYAINCVLGQYRALLGSTPTDRSTARKQALLRDGSRCMLSGAPRR
ncbi:hypothetical protein OH77DRAFT_666466 [Trametes cingulata]|nr:hypothetical protein OH77DRAFT_666466 [Trametes cingulata]